MNRSRNKRSRREIRRRRQLREKSQRIVSQEKEIYIQEETSILLLLKKYKVELLLIVFVVISVIFIISLGPDKKAAKKLQKSFDPFLHSRSLEWDEIFIKGYKIFVLTDRDIIQTSFDTLPDDLKINWKKMSVVRIQANQLNSMTEKIKITINDITYVSAGVSGLTAKAIFSRKKGASARLARFGKLDFIVKIVEEDNGKLFCLFGLKYL